MKAKSVTKLNFQEVGIEKEDISHRQREESNADDEDSIDKKISNLPPEILRAVLLISDSWKVKNIKTTSICSGASVCKSWRDLTLRNPRYVASLLLRNHGPDEALQRSFEYRVDVLDRHELLATLLLYIKESSQVNIQHACFLAAKSGDHNALGQMISWSEKSRLKISLDVGSLLQVAASCGHLSVMRLLLESCSDLSNQSTSIQRDSMDLKACDLRCFGRALWAAARSGQLEAARFLLQYPTHVVSADYKDGLALIAAAWGGHENVVILLLQWPKNAPNANCQDGEALIEAARQGHESVVRLLLQWPHNAPTADCQGGRALIAAARGGHECVVRLLLQWPSHAPRVDLRDGWALIYAIRAGHLPVVKVLLGSLTERGYLVTGLMVKAMQAAEEHPFILELLDSYNLDTSTTSSLSLNSESLSLDKEDASLLQT